MPDVLERMQKAIKTLNRPLKMMALDFQEQYWGDIGQHPQIYDFYMGLNEPAPKGEILRALADISPTGGMKMATSSWVTHTSAGTYWSRILFSSTSLLLVEGVLKRVS